MPYLALPELSLEEVDTAYTLYNKTLAFPLIIASMTGGSEHARQINTNLAIAAEECRVALGVGSQRIGLERQGAKETFELVRKLAPTTFIFANMGAVQLNYGHSIDSYRKIIDMIQADALYLHINPLQEALQPGGDANFKGLVAKIQKLVERVEVPVFVKEVGHGISGEVAKHLWDCGVQGIDVAGVGGTSYAWVEAKRSANEDFAQWFKTFGLPTDQAINDVVKHKAHPYQLVVASGGLRNPLDGLKARALGADLFSAALPFLKPAMESAEATTQVVKNWREGLKITMFASGAKDWRASKELQMWVEKQ